jgi:hypothetical protein
MKVKVTNKVKGEIVIPCLGGSLKKGDTLNIDAYKSSHQDVLWALHHGYLELLDKNPGEEPMGDVVCFTNSTNRTLTGRMFTKPLDPSRSIVVKKSDPVFEELMRMVTAGKLKATSNDSEKIDNKIKPALDKQVVTDNSKKDAASSNNNTIRSFKKTSSSKKKKDNSAKSEQVKNDKNSDILSAREDKVSASPKISNGTTVMQSDGIIFADMNGEVT